MACNMKGYRGEEKGKWRHQYQKRNIAISITSGMSVMKWRHVENV